MKKIQTFLKNQKLREPTDSKTVEKNYHALINISWNAAQVFILRSLRAKHCHSNSPSIGTLTRQIVREFTINLVWNWIGCTKSFKENLKGNLKTRKIKLKVIIKHFNSVFKISSISHILIFLLCFLSVNEKFSATSSKILCRGTLFPSPEKLSPSAG